MMWYGLAAHEIVALFIQVKASLMLNNTHWFGGRCCHLDNIYFTPLKQSNVTVYFGVVVKYLGSSPNEWTLCLEKNMN